MLRSFKKIFFSSLYLLFSVRVLFAQIPFSPQVISTTSLTTDFSKQNTTWNWFTRFNAAQKINQNTFWSLKETFQSNLITPANSRKQWKDEHRLKGLFYFKFKTATLGLYLNSWLLFDKQQSAKNEFSNHSAVLFSKYAPTKKISLLPYAGVQRAKNLTKSDIGWDVGIDGKAKNFQLGAYNNSLEASSNYDFFETRQNYNNKFSARTSTRFNKYTTDSIKVSYEESSKQFYNNDGSNLIEVKLFNRNIHNNLVYAYSNQDQFSFETNILSKNVSYITNRNVFFIENRMKFSHVGPKLNYEINFRTSDETLDNTGTITDSRTRQSALGLKSSYFLNDNSRINIDMAYVKLQYDTPNDKNTDDRDEQRFILNIGYTTKISPVLTFKFNSYGFLFHQIYLFKEQSINNNWNRVLKISPKIQYKTKPFKNSLSSSVIVNYTVFDFENLGFKIRSFLSRKFTLSDSLLIQLSKNFSVGLNARLELEEKGNFLKKKFAQNLIQSYQVTKYNFYLAQKSFRRLGFKIGYLFFSRLEWRHIPKKFKNRTITNQGPFANFYYRIGDRINISAYAAINYVDDSRNKRSQYSTGHLKLFYLL